MPDRPEGAGNPSPESPSDEAGGGSAPPAPPAPSVVPGAQAADAPAGTTPEHVNPFHEPGYTKDPIAGPKGKAAGPGAGRPKGLSKTSCAVCAVVFVLIAAAAAVFIAMAAMGFSAAVAAGHTAGDSRYKETYVQGSGEDKIALVDVRGVLIEAGGLFGVGEGIVTSTVTQLRRAAQDPAVKAVILRVDSPGGGVTASDIIYNEVKTTKSAGKKVVVLMEDVAASGGYYVSAPADEIIAHPTTVTGSIGVIMQTFNFSGFMKDHKVKAETIKSAPMKDIASYFRDMTPEERKVLQDVVDEMYDRFVKIVADGRGMAEEDVRAVAKGQIYAAGKAKEVGLVDSIGYWQDAVDETMSLAGLSEATVVRYARTLNIFEVMTARSAESNPLPLNVRLLAETVATPKPMYLWLPGH